MSDAINPVHSTPEVTQQQYTIYTKYLKAEDKLINPYIIEAITYTVTIYNHHGVEKTYTNSTKVSLLV